MGITVRVFWEKTDEVKHLLNLFVDDLFIPDPIDAKTFRDDGTNGHTGVDGGNRILENHLHAHRDFGMFGRTDILFVFFEGLLVFWRGNRLAVIRSFKEFLIIGVDLIDGRGGEVLIAIGGIFLSGNDVGPFSFNDDISLIDSLFAKLLVFFLNGFLRFGTRSDFRLFFLIEFRELLL